MPTRILDVADSYTTASLFREAQRNDGVADDQLAFSEYDMERFRLGDEPILYPNVNWYDYLMNKASVQTQHNVSISGGNKRHPLFCIVRLFVSEWFI